MVNDPIADMLVRLQNASRVGHTRVSLPTSKMKVAIAEVLRSEGYVEAIEKPKKAGELAMTLAYGKDGQPVVTGFKRVSKPSRRLYMGVHDIKPIKRGFGLLVLSTPAGVLSGKQAHDKKVGGEPLFEIW
jgi:small subunit ribosomal protein S8